MIRFFAVSVAIVLTARAGGLSERLIQFQADRNDLGNSPALQWSPDHLDRETLLLGQWQERLDAIDFDSLGVEGKVDWKLLRNAIEADRNATALSQRQSEEIRPLLAFSDPLVALLDDLSKRKLADPKGSADALSLALSDLTELQKRLDSKAEGLESVTPVKALRVAAAIDEVSRRLGTWFDLYDGFDPAFGWWNRTPYQALGKQLESYADHLRKEIAGQKGEEGDPLVGDPVGSEALEAALKTEMIDVSATELIEMGRSEFAWCQREMEKAASDLGCASVAEAIAKVKADHAPPGGQLGVAIDEVEKVIRFIEKNELVTIPEGAKQSWGLGMLGPEQQRTLPYAVYGNPSIKLAYAHESMDQERKLETMRGNARPFMHLVTPHELIPGHHLQAYMARRHAAYRAGFGTPFLVEGWALHWEMLLWDYGYFATPEEKVAALFWRMHRCARIIVSLKFHLGEMTPAEMVDFLIEKVGHERSAATSEVRRYIGPNYGPLYQAAYTIGGLQLRELRKDVTAPNEIYPDSRGKLGLLEFHDRVLQQGPIPIALIREALTAAPSKPPEGGE